MSVVSLSRLGAVFSRAAAAASTGLAPTAPGAPQLLATAAVSGLRSAACSPTVCVVAAATGLLTGQSHGEAGRCLRPYSAAAAEPATPTAKARGKVISSLVVERLPVRLLAPTLAVTPLPHPPCSNACNIRPLSNRPFLDNSAALALLPCPGHHSRNATLGEGIPRVAAADGTQVQGPARGLHRR